MSSETETAQLCVDHSKGQFTSKLNSQADITLTKLFWYKLPVLALHAASLEYNGRLEVVKVPKIHFRKSAETMIWLLKNQPTL